MQQVAQEIKNESDLIAIPSLHEFIERCLDYNISHPGEMPKIVEAIDCPVHIFAAQINKPCKSVVQSVKTCPVCGRNMCPQCGNHSGIIQLSRVTGYIQAVSGWNAGKVQELQDRRRHNIGVGSG
jgi:hypothetical protein